MIDKSRPLLDFPGFRFSDFLLFCMHISFVLFACLFFVGPPMTKAAYDALIVDFQTKLVASINSVDKDVLNARDLAYEALMKATRKLAGYVGMMCDGDRVKILLSGFNVFSPGSYPGKHIFTVVQGTVSGSAVLDWGADDNAKTYTVRYFVNQELTREVYSYENAGSIGCTINDLTKFKEYGFSLCSVYSNGDGPYSDPIFLTIL